MRLRIPMKRPKWSSISMKYYEIYNYKLFFEILGGREDDCVIFVFVLA